MFEALFSFSGRMGRIAYIGWGFFAVLVLCLVGGGVLGFGMAAAVHGSALSIGIIVGAGLLIVALWASLATATKRVRDMGFPPVLWIVGIFVLTLADHLLLTRYIGARFFWPFDLYTPIGGFISTVAFAMLLLWPPADEVQEPPASLERRFNRG